MIKPAIFFVVCYTACHILGCGGNRPASIGLVDNNLAPCPKRPNCVSSIAKDAKHFIEPFSYELPKEQAFRVLKQTIETQKRAVIVHETDTYLHAEFTSALFRFVDDVEFYFPKEESVIHVRSASRMGYSDMGVNRKRVEHIRTLFYQTLKK